ncbi:outer membrane beta-barrel protein [Hymenobacter negativus]|uniref:Outer membrane beta-barrel protein n=1 Tax=Hymenobacter negativus TaxID=2795026 RepID=A0ABS3QDH4_9BACT|nr:outer membrane beta-barrel protein [Hymenobacter negativus]MBO2009296.1 outer membrane beta-barrel protein [Hymenobacter negativus]
MKTIILTTAAALATSHAALAQEPAPRLTLAIGIANNYRFHSGDSRVSDYYGLGSKVSLTFNDTWLLGFSQLTSVAPGSLLRNAELGLGNARLSEYALTGGNKWHFAPKAYTLGTIQTGFGRLSWRNEAVEGGAGDAHASVLTVGAEAGIGYRLGQHLALEAGASYHRYFNNDRMPVAAKELNNFSAGLSLVGTFGLTKSR